MSKMEKLTGKQPISSNGPSLIQPSTAIDTQNSNLIIKIYRTNVMNTGNICYQKSPFYVLRQIIRNA
ncbi:hypothetical protein L596_001038 [Steinernema carpocapsae]|uniref:Uncharacterized protein n=1 Tax=Steinernema carpocapsae TaxID=34508 RepID=A0A4U8UL49_STECR|nr:hypothetical protein L596_001038 [Steinernema carpocapsae]